MSTIRDVAKLAEVSVATVSRVINNDNKYKMTDETRARVWQAITQLNYKAKAPARAASVQPDTNQSEAPIKVGCVLSITKKKYKDPFFMSILSSIEEELSVHGYELAFVKTAFELEDKKVLYNTFSNNITGLFLMDALNDEAYHFIRNQVPYIVGVDTQREDIDNVGYDHYRVAAIAVQHLIDRGHKNIGFIGASGVNGNIKTTQRYRGYYSSIHAAGLQIHPEWIIDCLWNEDICIEKIVNLCKTGNYPTAFFVASDLMAMAAMSGLYSLGISVPNEIAIMGLSNIEISKYSNPPLSTIEIPTREFGIVAVDLLLTRMNGYNLLPRKVILPTSLIIRSST